MSALSLTLNQLQWEETVHAIEVMITSSVLPAALQTLLTVLFFPAVIMVCSRWRKIGPSSFGLAFNLIVLYISTWVYFLTNILYIRAYILEAILDSVGTLYLVANSSPDRDQIEAYLSRFTPIAQCAGTATLTLNILFANTIICWRVCLLWRQNMLIVWLVCGFMLAATFSPGAADTRWACWPSAQYGPGTDTAGSGNMYAGFPAGVAAAVMTFATNVLATTLFTIKAVQSKQALQKALSQGSASERLGKVVSLVFESGAPYCAFWVVIVAWEAGMNTQAIAWNYYQNSFWDILDVLVNSALVPLVAIQATLVVLLLAWGKSTIENSIAPTVPPPTFDAYAPSTLLHQQFMMQHH